ncbi:MAG: crossover junction endodeoxyribonuclease RuvC [Bacteroidaceae bacterium]
MKTIIGIDPSTKTGYSIVEDGVIIVQGRYDTPTEMDIHVRARTITEFMRSLIREHGVKVAVIEGYAMNGKFNIIQMVVIGSMIRAMFIEEELDWFEISPTKVKQLTTRKGNATKADMRVHVEAQYDVKPKNNDIVDAIAIAMIGHKAYNLETVSYAVGIPYTPSMFSVL